MTRVLEVAGVIERHPKEQNLSKELLSLWKGDPRLLMEVALPSEE